MQFFLWTEASNFIKNNWSFEKLHKKLHSVFNGKSFKIPCSASFYSDIWTWELMRKENVYECMTSRVCNIYLSTKINQYSFESIEKEKVFA